MTSKAFTGRLESEYRIFDGPASSVLSGFSVAVDSVCLRRRRSIIGESIAGV